MDKNDAEKFRRGLEAIGDLAFQLAGTVLDRRAGYVAFCDSGMARTLREEVELTINKLEHLKRCIANI